MKLVVARNFRLDAFRPNYPSRPAVFGNRYAALYSSPRQSWGTSTFKPPSSTLNRKLYRMTNYEQRSVLGVPACDDFPSTASSRPQRRYYKKSTNISEDDYQVRYCHPLWRGTRSAKSVVRGVLSCVKDTDLYRSLFLRRTNGSLVVLRYQQPLLRSRGGWSSLPHLCTTGAVVVVLSCKIVVYPRIRFPVLSVDF